jgi:hypothetical protein
VTPPYPKKSSKSATGCNSSEAPRQVSRPPRENKAAGLRVQVLSSHKQKRSLARKVLSSRYFRMRSSPETQGLRLQSG